MKTADQTLCESEDELVFKLPVSCFASSKLEAGKMAIIYVFITII